MYDVNDTVICIEPSGDLEYGREYVVGRIEGDFVYVYVDGVLDGGFFLQRFALAPKKPGFFD